MSPRTLTIDQPGLCRTLLATTDVAGSFGGSFVFDVDRFHCEQLLDEHVAGEITTAVVWDLELSTTHWTRRSTTTTTITRLYC